MKGILIMDYGLWLCGIKAQYDQLDDKENKQDWLIDKINTITKIYLNDLRNLKNGYDIVCEKLTELMNKGNK